MMALRRWVAGTLSACLGLAGCVSGAPEIKPNLPQKFDLPPREDARFEKPVKYPHIPEQIRREEVAPNGRPAGGGPVGVRPAGPQ